MGIHSTGRGTVQRQRRAHLDRGEHGEILMRYKQAKGIEYLYNTVTCKLQLNGKDMDSNPKFDSISKFEGWCDRYTAEHDIEQ